MTDSGSRTGQTVSNLSHKQERVIVALLESRTIEEACRKAGISKALYYKWLNEHPDFAAGLKRRRDAVSSEALERLQRSLTVAVDVLVALLGSVNESVRRAVANDVISRYLKAKELGELEERLARIEEAISDNNSK